MYYEIYGDSQHQESVFLSSGLGGSHRYWEKQLAVLTKRFRVIVYDHLSTGKSLGSLPDGYSIADMANEVVAILNETDTEKAHFIGHALGGLVGLELAIRHPKRVSSLVLVNAWSKTDEHTKMCFEIRKSLLFHSGIEMYLKAQPLFLYPSSWMKEHAALLEEEQAHLKTTFTHYDDLIKRIAAIEAFDVSHSVQQVACPTGIIYSKDDLLVPLSCSVSLKNDIKNSRLYEMAHGGHACNITQVTEFNQLLDDFYSAL